MKGQILDFSIQNGGGLISGEDGKRYPFKSEEWKEQSIPARGMKVDFDLDENGQAVGVYKALGAASGAGGNLSTTLNNMSQSRNQNGQLTLFALYVETLTKRYAQFAGRASKREFWGYTLFDFVVKFAFYIVVIMMMAASEGLGQLFYVLWSLFVLAVFVPSLSVGIRRLHDAGKSGWLYLIGAVPVIGWIILIVLWLQPSVEGDNQWGGMPEN